MADQVMSAPTHSALSSVPPSIQRYTGNMTEGMDTAPASVDRVLSSPGRPLDPALMQDMGQRFGHDFSRVRVHTDAAAERSAQEVNANAYTVGNDIVFGKGRFSPGKHEGRKLIAHELAHTVQQPEGIRRNPVSNRPDRASIPFDYELIPDPIDNSPDSFKSSTVECGFQPPQRGQMLTVECGFQLLAQKLSGVLIERMERMRVDYEIYRWKNALERLKAGELDDTDLKYASLRNRLTGLKTSEVSDLISKIKAFQAQRDKDINDPNVKDPKKKEPITTAQIIQWLEVRKEISTPMPDKATINSLLPGMIDSYSISINDTNITVMPDTHGAGQNETRPATNFTGIFAWVEVGGKITDLKKDGVPFNPTKLEVTILTKYKDSPDATSGYGKGTTDSDKFNETKTLKVHEGQHGTDFISYLTNTPLPVSLKDGINGKLTPAQFSKILDYVKYITKDTCETTDQTGFSQDEFIKTPHGRASGITSCRKP